MKPEDKARIKINEMLNNAGWLVQEKDRFNPAAGKGVAVEEFQTDTGPADYILFINREPVGVIEAKREEEAERITVHEAQTFRYTTSKIKWFVDNKPLRFGFESTGTITRFTDYSDPKPRSREIFFFFSRNSWNNG